MITQDQKQRAYEAMRAAGFEPPLARELLAGPKGLRDEFAGQAMIGLISVGHRFVDVSTDAYSLADAMMKQRQEMPE